MIVFGLDISTNCTGYSLYDSLNNKILICDYIDTSSAKFGDWFEKSNHFFSEMMKIKTILKEMKIVVDCIFIEDILTKFSFGKTNIKTIISLARFNGIASYICNSVFDIKPIHINVTKARKLTMGHSVPRGLNSKEYVLQYVIKNYGSNIKFVMKKRKKDEFDNVSYDMSDSVIIAIAGAKMKE